MDTQLGLRTPSKGNCLKVPRPCAQALSSLGGGPAFYSEFEGLGTQGAGNQSLALLTVHGCVTWSLKSHLCEVITNCCPEHLPQIALTFGGYEKDSLLQKYKEHLTPIVGHFCFCAA